MASLKKNEIHSFCKEHNLTLISYKKHYKLRRNDTGEYILLSPLMIKQIKTNCKKYQKFLFPKYHQNTEVTLC